MKIKNDTPDVICDIGLNIINEGFLRLYCKVRSVIDYSSWVKGIEEVIKEYCGYEL